MASSGNAAEKIVEPDSTEPSMDEILASIRQIIADDEVVDEGKSERELYTHPTDPSNSNETADPVTAEAPVIDDMTREMEAAVAQEIAAEAPAAPVEDVQEKAAKVRDQINLTSGVVGGLTLEQRLEDYRARAKERAEAAIAESKKAKAEAVAPVAAPIPATPIPQAAAAMPTFNAPTADDVARALLNSQSGSINSQIEEMMRPIISLWLADNLPTLVERLVRDEIERVSRGRKG